MGVMRQILERETKKTAPKIENQTTEKKSCEKCGCPDLWESIYGDGVLRCDLCEPAPTPGVVGRRIGPAAAELEHAEPPGTADDLPVGADPADRFIEFISADGRTGLALRGFDNPRSSNFSPRICSYVDIGCARYERLIDSLQATWRIEIVGN